MWKVGCFTYQESKIIEDVCVYSICLSVPLFPKNNFVSSVIAPKQDRISPTRFPC